LTAQPLPAFSRGAIQHVSHTDLTRQLTSLHAEHSVSRTHRDLVQQLGGEFVYAAALPGRVRGRWLVLVRFGEIMEQRFGLSAEIPLIYDHYSDLQIRTVDSIPEFLTYLPSDRKSVSPEICFLSAPDPYMDEKSHRWSRPDRLLIPLPWKRAITAEQLLDVISGVVFSRDLYSVRGAVTGRNFFGRQRLMATVLDDVHNARVPGVFGMRKSGKTSLLQEMVRTSMASDARTGRKRAFIYQDLEHLSGFDAGDPVAELVADLIESLRAGLKAVGLRTREVAELPAASSLPQLRSALDLLLSRLSADQEIVLVLDEVEYLCPPQAEQQAGNPANQKVPQLFGVFRKLVQERGNFGMVISGLASASVEASELYGRPNPLFSFAKPYYIGPFTDEEGTALLRGVGRYVGLTWTDDAVRLAMAETGGSAMLLRELGSAVLRSYPENRTSIVEVGRADVIAVLGPWRRTVSSNLREVVLNLQRFYPYESELMSLLMSASADFDALTYDFPDQVNRLHQLGVIELVGDEWIPSRMLQMGWELVNRKALTGTSASSEPPEDFSVSSAFNSSTKDLISGGENSQVEFKQTATYNSHTGSKDSKIEHATIKTVAGFLNSKGGVLLVGVHDDGHPAGLSSDFSICSPRKDRDGFENWLYTCLTNEMDRSAVASFVRVSFEPIDDCEICRVDVEPSPQPVYVGEVAEFFIRIGNSTRSCNPREATAYIKSHWIA
jgi:hypothetical protein